MSKQTYPQFRSHKWLDTRKKSVRYGIQIKLTPEGSWCHCHKNGKPVMCSTEELVNRKIEKLREIWA